jgi:signal transduction histidine kinase
VRLYERTPPPDPAAQLRHDLANPLSAILAEAQLALLEIPDLDPEARRALQIIEMMALRIRTRLQER